MEKIYTSITRFRFAAIFHALTGGLSYFFNTESHPLYISNATIVDHMTESSMLYVFYSFMASPEHIKKAFGFMDFTAHRHIIVHIAPICGSDDGKFEPI